MSKKNEYGKACPKCTGYMHRCEEYVPAVYEGITEIEKAKGCFGQAVNAFGGRNHDVGNWWRCLFCDLWEPLPVEQLAKAAK